MKQRRNDSKQKNGRKAGVGRRALLLLCAALLLLSAVPVFAAQPVGYEKGTVPFPMTKGTSGILMDATTGKVLWEKNSKLPQYPASTTKLMTALLVLENLSMEDTIVIDSEVTSTYLNQNDIRFTAADKITVKDALYALFLESNNAIAVSLAKTVSGSVSAFAELMNERAKELGAENTHFVNPNGLHDDGHTTTAYDLALILKYCLTLPTFREYLGTVSYDFPATSKTGAHTITNTNWLLTGTNEAKHKLYVNNKLRLAHYDGIIGGKTGTTPEAGGCLAAAAKQDDTTLIAVTLHAGYTGNGSLDRYSDCIALLDWGFDNYKTVRISTKNTSAGEVPVKHGSVLSVPAIVGASQYATLSVEADENALQTLSQLGENLQAPVYAGDAAGVYQVYYGTQLLGEYHLVAANDVPEGGFLSRFGIADAQAYRIYRYIVYGLGTLAVISLAFLFGTLLNGNKPGRRRMFGKRRLFRG